MQRAFASYVPVLVRRWLAAGEAAAPRVSALAGALLFADVSDSTALAERLAESGPAGAERLGRILDGHLGTLIDVVAAHGGDVVKFAGDGLFALWIAADGGLPEATERAAACALAAQDALRRPSADGVALSMRMGVAAGTLRAMALAWSPTHLDVVLAGPTVAETCRAEHAARPGDVVLAPSAWHAAPSARGVPLAGGALRVTAVDGARAPAPADVPDVGSDADLRAWAPPTVAARLAAGQAEWLAEHRRVTVLFVQLPDWSTASAADAQDVVGTIAAVLARHDGVVARLGMGADGPCAKLAFGLPPRAHDDDPLRGVRAALDLRAALAERGAPAGVGVATGRVFCGAIGNVRRREYTTVGDAVNVAARLMGLGAGDVLCDAATAAACAGRVPFDALPPAVVKGKADPVAVHRPRRGAARAATARTPLVGRDAERAFLWRRVEELLAGAHGGVVVVEGPAGIGKSRLVADVCERAAAAGLVPLVGAAEAIARPTPYHAWRTIVAGALEVERAPEDADGRHAHVLARLDPALHELAPLLNPLVGARFPESALTAAMSPEARADNTYELVVAVLQRAADARRLLVVLEDAHWADSPSWAVTALVAQRVRPLVLVIATRPLEEPVPAEYRRLLQRPDVQRRPLEPLAPADVDALAARVLGVERLSEPVAAIFRERAGGHPFFGEQLAHALRDARVLVDAGGESRLAPGAEDLRGFRLPATVEGAITERIDRLPPRQQLAVKIASVFGGGFTLDGLAAVHPIDGDRAHLPGDLGELARLALVAAAGAGPETTWTFTHVITRDVAYELIPFAQRRALHRAVADWYERAPGTPDALLAHHRTAALDPERPDAREVALAVDALERAGERAVASFANREAIGFLEDALRLAPAGAETAARRARWERALGEACFRAGRNAEARRHLERAIALLGHPVPTTRPALLAREALRQAGHRLAPRLGARPTPPALHAVVREAARAYELLGLVAYLMMDSTASLAANLRALNLSETVPASPELATSCAVVGMSSGVLLGRRAADVFFRLGVDTARGVGDRHALARVWHMQGFYLIGEARWAEGEAVLERARATFEALGDMRWREIVVLTLGNLHQMHRRYARSLELYADARRTATQRGDVQARAWSSVGAGGALQALGRDAEALATYDEMAASLADDFGHLADLGSEFSVTGIRALAHLRRDAPDRAWTLVLDACRIAARSPLLIYYALPGRTSVAEVSLRLWERGYRPGGDADACRRTATHAVAALRGFARWFAIGRPQADVWQGLHHWLSGRRRRAHATWRRAVARAERLDMRHDLALAYREIGQHLPHDDPARARHLAHAEELLRGSEVRFADDHPRLAADRA